MDPLRTGYLLVFGLSAVACYAASWRAREISDRDTRVGLVALLVLSGSWAAASLARLLPYPPEIQQMFYVLGLVVGLASVGAWLYFCSAYAGHDYHRNPQIRLLAVAAFVPVTALKLTNPLHHLYFDTSVTARPFPHTVLELHTVHWVVTGLAYVLAGLGFYLLYELFRESQLDTRRLGALVAATAVPALFDVLAYTEAAPSLVLKFNFEPAGVAVFAVGALYVVDEQFVAVPRFWRREVIESLEEAIVVVDVEGRIRDCNATAAVMFPGVADAVGTPLEAAVPSLASATEADADLLELDRDGGRRFYRAHATALTGPGGERRGEVLIATDVTDIERQRRELRRRTEQFDDFAEAITHELRNTTTVIDGYLDLIVQGVAEDGPVDGREHLDRVIEEVGRLQTVIEELATLARHSETVEPAEWCDLDGAVEGGWARSETDHLRYEVVAGGQVRAIRQRLEPLLAGAFTFMAANGANEVTVELGDGEFTVAGDGRRLSPGDVEKALAFGEPVPSPEAGMALPKARMLARTLGWRLDAEAAPGGGLRLSIRDVTTDRA